MKPGTQNTKHKTQNTRFKIQVICFVAVIALVFLFAPTTANHAAAQACSCSSGTPSCADAKCDALSGSTCIVSDQSTGNGTCQIGTPQGTGSTGTIEFKAPTGATSFSDIVCNKVIPFFSQTILPPIAVLMMLVVGFLFMMGGQMPQKAIAAKKTLLYVIAGVVLLMLAPGILGIVADIVGSSSITACSGATVTTDSIVQKITKLINWFAWFISITSVVMGLYAGLLYLTARGDSSQVLKATKVFSYTIIGIAVSIVAFSIIILTKTFFGI